MKNLARAVILFIILWGSLFHLPKTLGFSIEEDFISEEMSASLIEDDELFIERDGEGEVPPPPPPPPPPPVVTPPSQGGSPEIYEPSTPPKKEEKKKEPPKEEPSIKKPSPITPEKPSAPKEEPKTTIPKKETVSPTIPQKKVVPLSPKTETLDESFVDKTALSSKEEAKLIFLSPEDQELLQSLTTGTGLATEILKAQLLGSLPTEKTSTEKEAPSPTIPEPLSNTQNELIFSLFNLFERETGITRDLFFITLCIIFIILLLQIGTIIILQRKEDKEDKVAPTKKKSIKQKKEKAIKRIKIFGIIAGIIMFLAMIYASSVNAAALDTMRYQGRLRTSTGAYAVGNYTFRTSLWDAKKSVSGDFSGNNINTSAPNYKGWQEEINVTITTNGYFSLLMGKNTPIPSNIFENSNNIYLQIEAKETGAPTYELIDASSEADEDRRAFSAVPYAKNADRLNSRNAGYSAGNLPYLDANALLPKSTIPSGTDENFFTIDNNNNATGNIALKFGEALSKTLAWNLALSRFEFNDDVYIDGDLILSGTVNGKTFSATNETAVLQAPYPSIIFLGDGNDNTGSMYEDSIVIDGKTSQTLKWTTQNSSLQDYNIEAVYTLPGDFSGWDGATPIHFTYKTTGDAKVDFVIEKISAPGTDQISGNGIALQSGSWTKANFAVLNPSSWVAGETVKIKIKVYAKSAMPAEISTITLDYIRE